MNPYRPRGYLTTDAALLDQTQPGGKTPPESVFYSEVHMNYNGKTLRQMMLNASDEGKNSIKASRPSM
jgi:hypothetical protein